MENNYRNFKLGVDHIGKFLVWKMRSTTKFHYDPTSPFGIVFTGLSKDADMFVVCQIDWYNKDVFPENDYKSYLHPVGVYNDYFTDRPLYNSDIESCLRNNNAEIFDDFEEANKWAIKKNKGLYPELF